MTYTKAYSEFLEDVKVEAVALREHATPEEISRLDLKTFDGGDFTTCIYGQMTGHCHTERAHHLIASCCKRFVNNNKFYAFNLDSLYPALTDSIFTSEQLTGLRKNEMLDFISSIEAYIMIPEVDPQNLIDFLKGNRKDLVL